MSSTSGPILPTDGLVFMVDAGNPRSFRAERPDRWYDLVGKTGKFDKWAPGNKDGFAYMQLGPGATYKSDFGGVLEFTEDSNGFARISGSYINLSSVDNTTCTFSRKLSNGNNGRVVTAYQNNWLLGHHDTTYGDYYAQGWVQTGIAQSDTTWRMYTGTGDETNDVWQLYVNDSLHTSNSGGSQGPNGFNVNSQYNQYSSSQVAMIACWERVLTASEISQVFEVFRKRFGI
tara:strand:- start:761 stop:1453 length:693 start_codon:yes stop_codon:yes gene_type:complete